MLKKIGLFSFIVLIVIGFVIYAYNNVPAQEKTGGESMSDWKTWTWDQKCGGLKVQYPSSWKIKMAHPRKYSSLGCNGEIAYFPYGARSFDDYREGIVLNFTYSETSAEAQTTPEKIEERIKESPNKSFFPSILRCIKDEYIERQLMDFECYARHGQGIYAVSGNIMGAEEKRKEYENKAIQVLKSFVIVK